MFWTFCRPERCCFCFLAEFFIRPASFFMSGKVGRIRMLSGIVLCCWDQLCIFLLFCFRAFSFRRKG